MAKQLQLRRGTTSQHSTFTGANGEVTVDTDKKVLVVHDGSTAGGIPLARHDTKVDKITSTDRAIALFNGTTGSLQNSTLTVDTAGNIGSGTQSFNGFGGTGFKNYIINGNFDVWQRGTSQTSDGYGSDDRWFNGNIGSTKTHSRVQCTDTERALFNASYFSRTVASSVAGASNTVYKEQKIEDVTKLAGKTITISFWAKADSNKNIAVEILQNFGTGGTPSTAVTGIGSQLVSLTATWQKKSITIAIPSIIGKTLGTDGINTSMTELQFWFDAGSNYNARTASLGQQSGTFDIAQVQLEGGSVATPFEQRPYGLELSLCQRYYETCYPAGIARGANLGNTPFAAFVWRTTSAGWVDSLQSGKSLFTVPKRVTPTMAYWDGAGNSNKVTVIYGSHNINVNVGSPFNNLSTNGFYSDVNVNANSATVFAYWEASAEL